MVKQGNIGSLAEVKRRAWHLMALRKSFYVKIKDKMFVPNERDES